MIFRDTDFVRVRPAIAADIPHVMQLERESSTAAHWSEQQYQAMFEPNLSGPERLVVVADDASGGRGVRLVGFLVARHLAPEWELENIVVAQQARRHGVGKRLMEVLLAKARETHSEAVFLEVRESNTAARNLYERAGFEQTGRRASYYINPAEDAILYRWSPV